MGRLGLPEPQEIRIAEFRRQGAIQFPQEPRVLRGREIATRQTRGVDLAQGVTQEAGLGARGDEERTVCRIGLAFERERPEDLLDSIELPVLEETSEKVDVGLAAAGVRENRDIDGADTLQADGLHVSQVRERYEALRKTEARCGLGVGDGHREIVTETSQIIERRTNR